MRKRRPCTDNFSSAPTREAGSPAYTPYGHHAGTREQRVAYTGQPADPCTQGYLLGNGQRLYRPQLMRFCRPDSRSPFDAGGINAYGYCAGDPINMADPSGHVGWWFQRSPEVRQQRGVVVTGLGRAEIHLPEGALGRIASSHRLDWANSAMTVSLEALGLRHSSMRVGLDGVSLNIGLRDRLSILWASITRPFGRSDAPAHLVVDVSVSLGQAARALVLGSVHLPVRQVASISGQIVKQEAIHMRNSVNQYAARLAAALQVPGLISAPARAVEYIRAGARS
ncbi:RHS repeat-associated core domain-containing protein [Pseudomonas cremoricolorata]|uniref:RHS repeat-associated core domain-containing protein n=1 Tax=Pseudomonas cremoricolorata TaxID=157783 RepID=UPI0009DC02E0